MGTIQGCHAAREAVRRREGERDPPVLRRLEGTAPPNDTYFLDTGATASRASTYFLELFNCPASFGA